MSMIDVILFNVVIGWSFDLFLELVIEVLKIEVEVVGQGFQV